MATKYVTLTGKESGDTIYPNIKPQNIEDESINAGTKITPLSITESRIANGAVTSDKLGAGAVVTDNLDDLSVTEDKLGSESVTAGKIKFVNETIRDYMFARGLSFTLANLSDLIISKIKSGFSFYWEQNDGNIQYVENLLAGVDDDNFVYFMGVRMDYSAPSPLTDRTETTYLSLQNDADVSQFLNGAQSDNLFLCGIGN